VIRRRKRRVRLHLVNNEPSVEGIFVGFWASHYVVAVPSIVTAQKSVELEGPRVRVHKHQVLLMEDLL